jgi:hypothetical protein
MLAAETVRGKGPLKGLWMVRTRAALRKEPWREERKKAVLTA